MRVSRNNSLRIVSAWSKEIDRTLVVQNGGFGLEMSMFNQENIGK